MPQRVPLTGTTKPYRRNGEEVIVDLNVPSVRFQAFTTRPTTGLVKGELVVLFHGSTPKIGVCSSTAAQTIKLVRLKTKTFGRLTA